MARLVVLALLLVLGAASAGSLRGAINKTQGAAAPAMAAPTTPGRGLTGSLENRQESVRATMPPVHPSRVEQVGTPPLVTLQGKKGQLGRYMMG